MTIARLPRPRWLLTACAAGLALAVLSTAAAPARAAGCFEAVLNAEHAKGIPPGLLLAMGLVESGMNGEPHPYAISMGGRAIYATDAASAARRVTDERGRPRNAFVGCLQIAVQIHRSKFPSIQAMFDPEIHANYAASYLRQHYDRYGSWAAAIARYQGGRPAQQRSYVCKVHNVLRQLDPVSAGQIEARGCRTSGNAVRVSDRVRQAFLDNADTQVAFDRR